MHSDTRPPRPRPRSGSSTSPSGSCRRRGSTASATPTSRRSCTSPRRASTTTSPTKARLGTELIARYHATFQRALDRIAAEEPDARRKLRRYAALYAGVLRKDRMCLCGMLASDFATLPSSMKDAVKRFFDANEAWLAEVLERAGGRGRSGSAARRRRWRAPWSLRSKGRCSSRDRTATRRASTPPRNGSSRRSASAPTQAW